MATVGFATLDVIPSVRGLRAQLDRQVNPGLAAAGRKGGKQFGDAAGTTAAQGFSSKLQSGLNGVGGKLFAGLGLAAAGKAIIGLQADFESSINVLGASADLTSAQMQQMAKFAKQMGAETVFSAGEAADAMVELAKAGLTPATIQAGALKATMAVAATEGLQLADAATIISNTMTTFGIEGAKAVTVADALAGGSKASTASVASLAEAMSQVGGSAADAGLSLQETTAALAAFDQGGIKGSDAGTSLKTMLSRLVPQTDKAANAMDDLHLSFTDATGQFLPLADIAGQLQKELGHLSDAERTTALNTIFGSDARRAAIVLMNEGKKGIEGYTRATSEAGVAQKLADARMSGTAGAIERMKGSIETAGLAFGEVLAPAVVVAANGIGTLADVVTELPGPVQAAAVAFVALKVASAFGVSGPTTSIASLTGKMDGLRLRTMLAADAFREARTSTTIMREGMEQSVGATSRLTASLRSVGTFAQGAGGALRKGLGGAIGMLGGPWGIALIAGAAALTKFKQGQAEAKAKIDEVTASLEQQTGEVTKQTEELAFKALQDKGVIDLANKYGISLDTVREASLGNADASRKISEELQRQAAAFQEVGKAASGGESLAFAEDAQKIQAALGGETAAVQASQREWRNRRDFLSSDTTSETVTTGMRDYAGEIDKARNALQSLIDKENERVKNAIKSRRDRIALLETLKAGREEADKGKKTLDENTQAGRDNMKTLLDIADQWANSTPKVRNAKGAYKEMRQEFINIADQMNGPKGTRKAAALLADELLSLPNKVPVKFQSEGYADLLRQIRELQKKLGMLGTTIKYPGLNKPVAPALERASGGPVFGAGTSTSDSIPAWLSNGEFVQRTRAVNYYGLDFMKRLNNLQIPKFANGGPVAAAPSSSGGGPGLVIDQRGATFQVADYRDFMQQTQRRAEASNLSGVRS